MYADRNVWLLAPGPDDVGRGNGAHRSRLAHSGRRHRGTNRVLIYGVGGPETCAEIVAVRTIGMTADTIVVHELVEPAIPEPPPVALDLVFPG
jgi:hypothetical protein